jgi:hypothetical protein
MNFLGNVEVENNYQSEQPPVFACPDSPKAIEQACNGKFIPFVLSEKL